MTGSIGGLVSVGWIGLGHMGGPMAANLVEAGHRVRGFDLSPVASAAAAAAGVEPAASITAAVADADVVITMLQHGSQVRAVLDEVLPAVPTDALLIDSSTIAIDDARALHELARAAGFSFLDAPVSGGVGGAVAGTLTFMIGGSSADLDRARPLIEVLAGRIFHIGGPGAGQAAKIVNNLMLGVTLAATCEAAVLAERLGLDHRIFHEMASVSSGDSWTLRNWYPIAGVVETAAVNRDFAGGFAVDLMAKDLGLALAAGAATDTPLTFTAAVAERLKGLQAAGLGDRDSSVFVRTVDGSLDA